MSYEVFPSYGARIQFDKVSSTSEQAHYSIKIFLSEAFHEFRVILTPESKNPDLESIDRQPAEAPDIPDWINKHIQFYCRQLTKTKTKKGRWTRRIREWKEK